MTVADLVALLEYVDDEVTVKSPEGKEYSSICLFLDRDGNCCVTLE
jgi:hypothetical protein